MSWVNDASILIFTKYTISDVLVSYKWVDRDRL